MIVEIIIMKTFDQIKGEFCEMKNDIDYAKKRCLTIKLDKGADRLVLCPKESFFSESKCNKSKLTPPQREFKEVAEFYNVKYKLDKCNCKTLKSIFQE